MRLHLTLPLNGHNCVNLNQEILLGQSLHSQPGACGQVFLREMPPEGLVDEWCIRRLVVLHIDIQLHHVRYRRPGRRYGSLGILERLERLSP